METKEEFPFLWDGIHKYSPKKEIARLRKKLMEEYRSDEYTDTELMERYHVSKQTLYDTKRLDGHLMQPPEPFMEFTMDFTEKVIAGGEHAYIFDLIDKYDNEKIILDVHKTQDADAVISSLEKFGHRGVTITVDNGKEFKNHDVLDHCSKHDITLDFVNKGSPWENAFIERDIRTLHEECLNLVWINNISEIQPLLDDFKNKSNRRPNMAFDYMSPLEKLAEFFNRKKNISDHKKILTREISPLIHVGV